MTSYISYLLSDTWALNQLHQQLKPVTLPDIRRHLMLLARQNNNRVPDHIYRLGEEKTFEGIDSLAQLFTEGLKRIANEFLEMKKEVVYVKACKQNEWQLLMTKIPPLLLVAVKINQDHILGNDCINYLETYIVPNVKYTAIPSPDIPQLQNLRERKKGLCDMHIHLNGSLEADVTWQDMLAHTDEIDRSLKKAREKNKVKEQADDILGFMPDYNNFPRLLNSARKIRNYLYSIVVEGDNSCSLLRILRNVIQDEITSKIDFRGHPMRFQIGARGTDIQMECLLYCKILDFLNSHPDCDLVANLFLYYLLILGTTNRLLVQQIQCTGFEEFQKYTLNELRSFSETLYKRRFLQLAGNALNNVSRIEGKFSPKDSIKGNEQIVSNIMQGIEQLRKHQKLHHKPLSEVQLIAHFIKEPESKRDPLFRYKILRHKIMHKAEVLATWKRLKSPNSNMLTAIDAAASELDTPPEVFAPAYRYLRSEGISHFSYHAGEDFFHILSGMRAVFEAIDFLDLRHGDRIGHATACGLSVHLWHENIGPRLLIRKGEWMDDLIFAAYLINTYRDPSLLPLLPVLGVMISNYSQDIYGENYALSEHIRAWLIRKEDPECMYYENKDLLTEYILYLKYHDQETAKCYNEIIEIDSCEPFDEEGLEVFQKLVLRYMHDKEIVIEMLPTSNVLISHHHDFSTYHFSNWLKWQKEGCPMPAIILGTDDPGIFATNIYNEYCNIFCHLVYHDGMSSFEALKILEELDYNSRIYAFRDEKTDNYEEEISSNK